MLSLQINIEEASPLFVERKYKRTVPVYLLVREDKEELSPVFVLFVFEGSTSYE